VPHASAQEDLLTDVRAAYQREAVERRRLHNLVQELRGNIRVYVRVKPIMPDEAAAGATSVLRSESDSRISCNVQGNHKARLSAAAAQPRPQCMCYCFSKHHRRTRPRRLLILHHL
jgi:hypothetical protein